MLLFTTILNIKCTNKQRIAYVLSMSISSILVNLLIPNPIRSVLNFVLIPVLIFIVFKTSILKSILAACVPLAIIIVLEMFITKICTSSLNLDLNNASNIPILRISITGLIYFLTFLIYLLIKYMHFAINIIDNMDKKYKSIFIIDLIIGLIALCIQFCLTGFYINILPFYIILLSIISVALYFSISIFTLTRGTKLQITELLLEQEKESNKILQEMQDDLHGFRHDFSNILCTIGGYVQVKDMEGLSKYYYQIQKDATKINNLGALNSDVINNPAVFILISSKYSKALEAGIEMNVNVFLDLNTLNMKIYEFTRVLGILLDNALQAAKDCDEKIINIEIRKDSNHNRQLLIIENTYPNKDIDIEKIFEKEYSTKKGNTGLGLWEVRQILKRNTNLNLFTTKDDKLFKQQLEMYNY